MSKKEVAKKGKKEKSKKEVKKYDPDEIPVLKSPGQTVAGKIIVLIIVGGMTLASLVSLIVLLFK